ncbi:MAG TPA: hypothetical protein VF044_00765 [Actinomycetota bacterium]
MRGSTDLPVGVGGGVRGPARRLLDVAAVRSLVASVGGSVVGGVVAGGVGARLVMRISAVVAEEDVRGALTENGNRVGEITVEGTIGLLVFGGIFTGLVGAPLLLALRRLLPARRLPLWVAAVVLTIGSQTALDPRNSDFVVLGARALNVAMFASLFLLYAAVAVWSAERLETWLVRPPLVHLAGLGIVGGVVGAGLGLLAMGTLLGFAEGPFRTTAVAAAIVATIIGGAAAFLDDGRRRSLDVVGRASLAVACAAGGWALVTDLAAIL